VACDGSSLTPFALDHVLIAVSDLAEGGRRLEKEHGLASVEGGRHPGWGTANRIVPLGATYLELIAVVDEAEAVESTFGRWVASAAPGQLLGWAVRTDRLDDVVGRLGLTVDGGARVAPDGAVLRWRTAGKEEAVSEPSLPFFIEWDAATTHPGQAGPEDARLERLEIEGDARGLANWLGAHALPIVVREGPPRVARVVISGPDGPVVLVSAPSASD
jgi:Glyoxalase-like domain